MSVSESAVHVPEPMEPRDFKSLAELQGEDLAMRLELESFCVGLVRSLLQNSYYSPDHPQARSVVDEPFGLMTRLATRWPSLTFGIPSNDESDRYVVLEGAFREPVRLEDLIGGAAGEHYSKKLHGFALRHHLISFTMPMSIPQDEFHRFVAAFVETHVDGDKLHRYNPKESVRAHLRSLANKLTARHVTTIKIVAREDLLEGRRRLPWRVRVSLSRLNKDLRQIPLMSGATADELRRTKIRLLREILRPLGRPSYLRDFFMNLDLIAGAVETLADDDLEEDLIALLPGTQVVNVGGILLAESRRDWWEDGMEDRPPDTVPRIQGQLRIIAARLAGEETAPPAAEALLKELYRDRHVRFSALPHRLQAQLEIERMVEACKTHPIGFIARFDEIATSAAYSEYLRDALLVFPPLLERRAYIVAEMIIQTIARHRAEPEPFSGRLAAIEGALGDLSDPVTRGLVEVLTSGSPQTRHYVAMLLPTLGEGCIPLVMMALEITTEPGVARDCAEMLIALRALGAEAARNRLALWNTPPRMTCALIDTLAGLKDLRASGLLQQHARHEEPMVRAAALIAVAALHGPKASPLLRGAMTDPHGGVAVRAVELLSELTPREPAFVRDLLRAARGGVQSHGQVPAPELRVAAIRALSNLGNARLGARGSLEDILVGYLGEPKKRGLLDVFRSADADPERPVKVALCEALDRIGGRAALERLRLYESEPDPVVRTAMAGAANALARRVAA